MPAFKSLFRIILVAIATGTISTFSFAQKAPNILFILVDDMRFDDYHSGGHSFVETPNIDRIAKEGADFKNMFCTTPLCSPSRAAFLTGQYAHHNRIIDNTAKDKLSHELITFPRILKEKAGYQTAFIGKWHMGNDDSRRPGFDYWIGMPGQGEAIDPLLNVNGTRQRVTGYVTDLFTNYALDFLEQKEDKPFLLYLSHKALHPNVVQRDDGSVINIGEGEFIAAERHKSKYIDKMFSKRPNYGIPPADKPALMRTIGDLPPLSIHTATAEKTIRDRAEMLLAIDEGLGKLMEYLEQRDLLNNTILVVTGDNGFWYGEHGLNEERRLAYEEGIRIPLIMRYPPLIRPGLKINEMVQNIDLAPGLLSMCGITPPATMDGRSILPLFDTKKKDWRKELYFEYYSDIVFPRINNMGYKAIRTDRYKYIRYHQLEDMDEVYDLKNDPYELNNIYSTKKGKKIQTKYESRLKSFGLTHAR